MKDLLEFLRDEHKVKHDSILSITMRVPAQDVIKDYIEGVLDDVSKGDSVTECTQKITELITLLLINKQKECSSNARNHCCNRQKS